MIIFWHEFPSFLTEQRCNVRTFIVERKDWPKTWAGRRYAISEVAGSIRPPTTNYNIVFPPVLFLINYYSQMVQCGVTLALLQKRVVNAR